MERALDLDALAEALGLHPGLPSADELQRLIADMEVALIVQQRTIPSDVLSAAWYLHGVASSDPTYQLYPASRQRRAFVVSAHIFDLAQGAGLDSRREQLEAGFAAGVGYMRGGLEPNATAIYRRLRHLIVGQPPVSEHMTTLAMEAGLALLGLQTQELFTLFTGWRGQLVGLARQLGVQNLQSTSFGTAESVVLGADDLLNYLAFGTAERLERARVRLGQAMRGESGPEDVDGRWVASHLTSLAGDMATGSVWAIMPPSLPAAAKQAFTLSSPNVLALWEPQRALLAGTPSTLDGETRRVVVSVPTSAGKTLLGQLMMVSHLSTTSTSVCYVAPTRSLCREVRRAMAGRLRILQKETGLDQPDYGLPAALFNLAAPGTWADLVAAAVLLSEADAPEVEVMTPERLAHMLRHDAASVLARFGMFVFDEAQLIGEAGRGFTAESLLAFLHWRTRESHHRIVLLSAAMGNAGQILSWLQVDGPTRLETSDWRGPRRLHAVFTTDIDWLAETRRTSSSTQYPLRLSYPLKGKIRLRVAEGAEPRRLEIIEPVGQVTFKATPTSRGPRDTGSSTANYRSAAKMIVALGHAGAVLVVTSTRDAARRMAQELASLVPERSDVTPLVDLARLRLGDAHPLIETLRHGVAFHHAALPTDVLETLEEGLRDDRLSYLTCTSTLTEGVNLPVRTVVISETRYEGQPTDAQIAGARLINALGRAGRAGRETEGWLVLVLNQQAQASDFDLLSPSADDIEVRSQLANDAALEALAEFESTVRAAQDAVFETAGRVGDFIAFVWFILAAEEELGVAADAVDVDGALQATLAFQQLGDEVKARWRAAAAAVRATYSGSEPERRKAWIRAGTSIGSARRLDRMSAAVAEAVVTPRPDQPHDPTSVHGSLAFLNSMQVLDQIMELPERPSDWRFRLTSSGQSKEVVVDLAALMDDWLSGR